MYAMYMNSCKSQQLEQLTCCCVFDMQLLAQACSSTDGTKGSYVLICVSLCMRG